MPAMTGYYDTLKSVAGKVFTYLASITITGTDGKTLTVSQDVTLDEAVNLSAKVTGAAVADYGSTSTIVGIAAGGTRYIGYVVHGKMVFVFFSIDGTGNATTFSFTVPHTTANIPVVFGGVVTSAGDNGIALTAEPVLLLGQASNVVTIYKAYGGAANTWTAANNKYVYGSMWYLIP